MDIQKNNIKEEKDYYVTDSYMFACVLRFITGQIPLRFDGETKGSKTYSFINDDNFKKARKELWKLRQQFNNEI